VAFSFLPFFLPLVTSYPPCTFSLSVLCIFTSLSQSVFSALPKDGPEITGEEGMYQIGDVINLNCTSGKSYPPARLRWYINGRPVSLIPVPRRHLLESSRRNCSCGCRNVTVFVLTFKDLQAPILLVAVAVVRVAAGNWIALVYLFLLTSIFGGLRTAQMCEHSVPCVRSCQTTMRWYNSTAWSRLWWVSGSKSRRIISRQATCRSVAWPPCPQIWSSQTSLNALPCSRTTGRLSC
jgi:hypothetical protein